MMLLLKRKYFKSSYTIGELFVDGERICETLEDTVRDLSREEKVPGQTAIPAGTYRLILSESKRFGRILPEILGVPHFTGIRMHGGTKPEHTEGCILVGKNTAPGTLTGSREAMARLMGMLYGKKDIWITIK